MNKVDMHMDICNQLNKLYEQKNHDYGDSFHAIFLEEGMAMARIRLSDKLNRFKQLSRTCYGTGVDERLVKDESIEDTLMDLANYAIMTVMEMRIEKDDRTDTAEAEIGDALVANLPYIGAKSMEVRL